MSPTQPGGATVYVHFNTVATTTNAIDTATTPYPRNLGVSDQGSGSTQDPIASNLGNLGQRGIRLQHNNRSGGRGTGDANAQVLRISFRTGMSPTSEPIYVRNAGFHVTDIDAITSGDYRYADRVSLLPNPTTAEQFRDTNVTANVFGGYSRLLLRHQPGQAGVEVSDGTLSMAAAQPVVVALFRTAFSSGTVVKAWPKRGLPRSK